MKVNDFMTDSVEFCEKTDSIEHAASLMKERDIGVLPVLEQGRVIGMVTDRDLVIRGVAERKNGTVDQVMTHNVISVTADTSAEEAVSLMAKEQVRRLPVIENGRVVGMISLGDLSVQPQSNDQAGDALSDISQP
ncbi:CBS domain-containing protein [Jeotgalibacillus soli]|uniref:CBS domain-containing protein n=1 Tax=Jeotgalibacillus soli TaxID=889306 RepID=A0A0C2SDZ8_9BACL|nr:CBS domain-containing protein [Jeotgalibacillus soli]KIL52179.1 hypothetical protein KP78_05490 [Jeotgalibacillus soli]